MMLKTRCVILRQIPFQESGRVLACFSRDYGRLDFLVKGVAALGPKKYPSAGLFRELAVEFRQPTRSGTLLSMRNRELLTSFDAVSLNVEHYLAACRFAAFLLANTKPMLEMPETYDALKRMLTGFTNPDSSVEPLQTVTFLAFLDESGLIPAAEKPAQARTMEKLLAAARGGKIPDYSPEYWDKIRLWCLALIRHNRINLES